MEKCLHISKKYESCYVALVGEDDTTVVGSSATPMAALKEAEEKGYSDPLFFFVPDSTQVMIY